MAALDGVTTAALELLFLDLVLHSNLDLDLSFSYEPGLLP